MVTALSERPTAELEAMRDKARADVGRATVELELAEQALAHQARAAKPHRARSGRKQGSTRKRVLKIIAAHDGPISPSQIRLAMSEEGKTLSGGGLYTLMRRLVDEGELHKIANGAYTLPANGSDQTHRPTENGASGAPSPLRAAPEGV